MSRLTYTRLRRGSAAPVEFVAVSLVSLALLSLSGCEEREGSIARGSYSEKPIKDRVDAANEVEVSDMLSRDSSPPERDLASLDMTPIDVNYVDMTPVDMTPVDMTPVDMMTIDQALPCVDGESRLGQTCGFDECVEGVWRRDVPLNHDPCNLYDDDCDGVVDEPPGVDITSSNCCDTMYCYTRSYCEEGDCVDLPDGGCRLPGDCEVYEGCQDGRCARTHTINPPASPSSCREPVDVSIGEEVTSTGDQSAQSASTSTDSGCVSSRERDASTALGREVIFEVTPPTLGLGSTFDVRARVTVNGIPIQSVLTVFDGCSGDAIGSLCVGSEEGSISAQFTFRSSQSYYFILDTYGEELEQTLLEQLAQYEDVTYTLMIARR